MKSGFEDEDPTAAFMAKWWPSLVQADGPQCDVSTVFLMVLKASTRQGPVKTYIEATKFKLIDTIW
ncbi:hypothetical protein AbraIFM66951_006131 [Aspergillus brasiliensis]|uniref:Uncharacterized protein n=1 Tax=Aspergillus brasiliensis TaxID=319629 RepID=A0A9W5Z2U7_9EURO|nr:hypothetical protein AbraCBS73388_005133 [Aspergillus brasiliensis]GKZ51577.1 hypothetical protein AbraIFM66951_006131 [Aspergillus brasiliensis]